MVRSCGDVFFFHFVRSHFVGFSLDRFLVGKLYNLLENWLSGQTRKLICITFKYSSCNWQTYYGHWISNSNAKLRTFIPKIFHASTSQIVCIVFFMHLIQNCHCVKNIVWKSSSTQPTNLYAKISTRYLKISVLFAENVLNIHV